MRIVPLSASITTSPTAPGHVGGNRSVDSLSSIASPTTAYADTPRSGAAGLTGAPRRVKASPATRATTTSTEATWMSDGAYP